MSEPTRPPYAFAVALVESATTVNFDSAGSNIRTLRPATSFTRTEPFDNARTTITLSGAQFRELMRLGTIGKQGIMQLSGGRIVLDPSKPEEQRVVSLTKSDGTPVRDDQTYVLVTNDFLAAGGDGLLPLTSTLKPEQIRIEPEVRMRDVVIAELQKLSKNGPIEPRIEDRIHYLQ